MLEIDPKVVLDYSANVLPKKVRKLSLSELDKAVDKAVECATKEDEKGLKSAMELIGRLMVKHHETPKELADYAAQLRAKGVDEETIKYVIAHRCESGV